jgi:SAM-dependent methyltransferase
MFGGRRRPWSRSGSDDLAERHATKKFEWMLDHLQCPVCFNSDLLRAPTEITCGTCAQRFPILDGAIDFIDATDIEEYGLIETENISDHPFDGNALAIIDRCKEGDGMVLDCGSGYKSIAFDNVVQMDIARFPNIDALAANQRIPFQDGSFDAIFSLDVLEHVNEPFLSAMEITRVLKPGGYLYVDMPFLQSEHGYPNHYFNSTRMGLRKLFESLECVGHIVPVSGSPIFLLHQLLCVYRDGLPEELRRRLDGLTVADILSKSPIDWLEDSIIKELRPENAWQIASTTQAVFRKEDVTSGSNASLTVAVSDLPGFAPGCWS